MPARLAFPWFYRTLTKGMDEGARLRVDEILGDPTAPARRAGVESDAIATSGFEVG